MGVARFLALTASDEWLTARQLLERLTAGHYWESKAPAVPVHQRFEYVIGQLESVSDSQGNLLFASVELLDARGVPVRVYKQVRYFGAG
jgi:hypothetical protein